MGGTIAGMVPEELIELCEEIVGEGNDAFILRKRHGSLLLVHEM